MAGSKLTPTDVRQTRGPTALRRAVVTGLGAVTPLGVGVPEFWGALTDGCRGIRRLCRFDPTGLRNERGGQIVDWSFDPREFGLNATVDLATQFLLVSAREAVRDAGLEMGSIGTHLAGAVLATNFGGALSWENFVASWRKGQPSVSAFEEFAFDTALDHLCRIFGLRGPATLISVACASGSAALGAALDLIRYGRADLVICGGYDALAPSPLAGLSVLRTMSAEDILPFSANRSGTLFGEGAGVLVVEELERARARDARIYCEVLGSWQNNNAYHLTAPDPGGHGMIRVLAEALRDGGVQPQELDYINAHGTGTEYHDPEETHAIKTVLGEHAYRVAVSSIKGAIAHLMGAAGSVEAVATVKALETGVLPPTINDGVADREMDLDFVVNASRPHNVDYAASLSAGVGGSNACVVFRKDTDPSPPAEHGAPAARPCRCVITGLGPISAIGIGREEFWSGLAGGREGRRPPQRLAEYWPAAQLLAECLDFVVDDYLESEKTYLDRCSELVLAACALTLRDAGLDWRELDHPTVGLAIGTAFGCLDSMHNVTLRVQEKGVRFASPVIFTHSFINSPASLAAIEYALQGPVSTVCAGDVSAGAALQYAFDLVRWGRARVMLAGGVEALSAPLLTALRAGKSLHPNWVPGEGACLMTLEPLEAAQARGAPILGELLGVGLAGDSEGAIELATAAACEDAGLNLTPPQWCSPGQWGHTFGASLALEIAAALWSLQEGVHPAACGSRVARAAGQTDGSGVPPDLADQDAWPTRRAEAYTVTACDRGGRAAAVVVRRCQ